MNKLKEVIEKILCEAIEHQMDWEAYYEPAFEEPLEKIMEVINQNYISKEQILNLECLKEEEEGYQGIYKYKKVKGALYRNQLRKEIKEAINKL